MFIGKKHLKNGDEEPTHPCDGALELLSMRFCPYAQRIHLVLDTKRIPYETVYINLGDKPDWLTKFSPLGKVPALGLLSEANSPYLVESLIVADYLDDKYPGDGGGGDGTGRLHPSDALAKALDRLLVDRFGALFGQTVYRMMTGKGDADTFPALLTGLDHFETELRKRGRPFFGKSTTAPGMLDLMIWPFFERTALLKPLLGDSFAIPFEERYPHLKQWQESMIANTAVQKTYLPGEVHAEFMKGHNTGTADYDILLKGNPNK